MPDDNKEFERENLGKTAEEIPNSRRKLIKAGIIGIPVVLTVKGKSAWAKGGYASQHPNYFKEKINKEK